LDGLGEGGDLVVVALPGVQRFIAEARSTADVSAASEIYSALAEQVVNVLRSETGAHLVLPADNDSSGVSPSGQGGMPNRVVALLPAGTGAPAARRASEAVHEAWQRWVRRALEPARGEPLPATPGFPCVQWVCVPADPAGYREQWLQAQRLLAARRRTRDFPAVPEEEWRQRALCSLAPRWPAERNAPPKAPRHEQRTPLSAVGWVKRRWRYTNGASGFPSTASIASAPYRRAVLQRLADPEIADAVTALDNARRVIERVLGPAGTETPVPGLAALIPDGGPGAWLARSGGAWVYPEQWRADTLVRQAGMDPARDGATAKTQIQDAVSDGLAAATRLRHLIENPAVRLANYLAVVVQDLDSMGLFLSGQAGDAADRKIEVLPNEHRRVSQELLRVAEAQRELLEAGPLLGVPVYAGGDDLLAFCPASTAIDAAATCQDKIPPSLPHASTAVLFFHYHASIQQAMSQARSLLDQAKEMHGKHGLAVGYLRRSGVSAVSIQPWADDEGNSSAHLFGLFAREREPRVVAVAGRRP
jgi:CRISPR-associated protein